MAKTEFEQFIADEIEKGKGRYIPVKAGPMERLFVKKAACTMLHPNPDDEWKEKVIARAEEIRKRIKHQ